MTCSSMFAYQYLLLTDLDAREVQFGQALVLAIGLFLVVTGHSICRLTLG
jgi:hypothetical protein